MRYYSLMFLPEREGGGGAPTFLSVWARGACAKKVEREPETDPQGTVGLGCSLLACPCGARQ